MEMTLGNHLTLEDLPKPGETIYLDGFISKHATETLNIASMQTVTGKDVAVWAQVSTLDTEAVIVIDESSELFSVAVKDLGGKPLKEGIGYLWSDAILGGNGDGSIINAFTAAGIVIY